MISEGPYYLSQHSLRATAVSDIQQMKRVLSTDHVDALVVDLNLGHEDGLEIVRHFSTTSDAPIIIISGDRLDEADRIVGLELGARYYITKPFGMQEFLARIRASLRMKSPSKAASRDKKDRSILSFADWRLNLRKRKLISAKNQEIKLTAGEFNLLHAFLQAPKQILSREQLILASRIHHEEIVDRSIDVLILRLRRKLEVDSSYPKLIKTERGIGYYFDADVTAEQTVNARPVSTTDPSHG